MVTYSDFVEDGAESSVERIRESGAVVVQGVVPEEEAVAWLEQIKAYVAANPSVKGFPADNKQVFEL